MTPAEHLLERFNDTYVDLHKRYEDNFWTFRMGDPSAEGAMNAAETARDRFRSDPDNLNQAQALLDDPSTSPGEKERLRIWKDFFALYQTPASLAALREEIGTLESAIALKFSTAKEG